MNTQPPIPNRQPAASHERVAGLPPLDTPATLEALLSLHPTTSREAPFPVEPVDIQRQTRTGLLPDVASTNQVALGDVIPAGLPTFTDAQTHFLFIHAGTRESALVNIWLQSVLGSDNLHATSFVDNALEQLMQLMPHMVLVDFESTSTETASELVVQMRGQLPQVLIVAVGRSRDPQCMLAALRAGVQDFLDVDGSIQSAQQTMKDLLRRSSSIQSSVSCAPLSVILSARAGLGASLLASHLACYLQQYLRMHSAESSPSTATYETAKLDGLLIDLGHPSGDCSLYLNTPSEFDFMQALGNLHRFDRRLASSGLSRHINGLRLLSLPRKTDIPSDTSRSDTEGLMQRLRQFFRHVVVDLGASSPALWTSDVMRHASNIWVLCDQSVPSVVSTTEMLQQLSAQKIASEKLQLIVSRYDSQLELNAQQIAQQLDLPLLAVIPECRRELAHAVNQGQLLSSEQRRDPYVQAVTKLSTSLLSAHHPGVAVGPESASSASMSARLLTPLIQRLRRS